jgi:hypothetical protein
MENLPEEFAFAMKLVWCVRAAISKV